MSVVATRRRESSLLLRATMFVGLVAIVAAVLAVVVSLLPGTSGATVGLAAVNNSPAAGTLTVAVGRDDRATLTLSISGLTPGAEYPVHLHSGTFSQPAASVGVLGTLTAGADGSAQLSVSSVRAGATGASVDLTGSLLADGPRFVDVHAEGAADPIALAAIPASGR